MNKSKKSIVWSFCLSVFYLHQLTTRIKNTPLLKEFFILLPYISVFWESSNMYQRFWPPESIYNSLLLFFLQSWNSLHDLIGAVLELQLMEGIVLWQFCIKLKELGASSTGLLGALLWEASSAVRVAKPQHFTASWQYVLLFIKPLPPCITLHSSADHHRRVLASMPMEQRD